MLDPGSAGTKKSFLKRGSGWKARVQATREGRRYRPKGGAVVSYEEQIDVCTADAKKIQTMSKLPRCQTSAGHMHVSECRPCSGKKNTEPKPVRQLVYTRPQSTKSWTDEDEKCHTTTKVTYSTAQDLKNHATKMQILSGGNCSNFCEQEESDLEEFCKLESAVLQEVSNTAHCNLQLAETTRSPKMFNGNFRHQMAMSKPTDTGIADKSSKHMSPNLDVPKCSSFAPVHQPRIYQEEDNDLETQSNFDDNFPTQPTSNLVQNLFYAKKRQGSQQIQSEDKVDDPKQESVEQVEDQVKKLHDERAALALQRRHIEDAKARLKQEQNLFENRKAEELAQLEAIKIEEHRKLQRDRRVLEKQSRALLKLPTKRDKEELQALEAVLERERQNSRGKDARHKLTVERLRRQIAELQDRNCELQEQIQYLEAQRLQHWDSLPTNAETEKDNITMAAAEPKQANDLATETPDAGGPNDTKFRAFKCSKNNRHSDDVISCNQEDLHTSDAHQACEEPYNHEDFSCGEESEHEGNVTEVVDLDTQCTHLPPVRISLHKQMHGPPYVEEVKEQKQDEGQQGHKMIQPMGNKSGIPEKVLSGAQLAAVEVPNVMKKATLALDRFNQLKQSILKQGSMQDQLANRLSSMQGTPKKASFQQPAENYDPIFTEQYTTLSVDRQSIAIPAPAMYQTDDLRRLGGMLTSAGGGPPPTNANRANSCLRGALNKDGAGSAPVPAAEGNPGRDDLHQIPPQWDRSGSGGHDAQTKGSNIYQHDNQIERTTASGMQTFEFSNGSKKQQWPDGHSITSFSNGDVKKSWPDGKVEYFYAEVHCWHVTHAHKVEVFFFPSGQVEAHHPGGLKEIMFPDGSMKKVLPDGRELSINKMHLSQEIQLPRPDDTFPNFALKMYARVTLNSEVQNKFEGNL